ncbi:MAG TPA: META domain-containing protein [Jatrophihabitantaceae bacterium]|jgi:heat shock protein HslJ
MTDELMDARLRAAGERWRAAEPTPLPPSEPALVPHPAPVLRHRARWVVAVSAAVIAAALVVSGAVLLANRNTNGTPIAGPLPSESHASAPQPSVPLVGTLWKLTQVIGRSGSYAIEGKPSLQFTSTSRFLGTDGCNSLGGKVTVAARTITMSNVMSTMVACSGSSNVVSGMLMSGTLQYRIVGSSLILTRAGEATLIYRAASSAAKQNPAQLMGSHWTLQSTEVTTHSGSNVSASGHSAVAQSVLTFDGRGGFTVQHRCYTNQGKAALGAGTAEFSAVSLKTAVPCSSGTNVRAEQQENAFVDDLLRGRVTWHIDQNVLTISKGGHSASFGR